LQKFEINDKTRSFRCTIPDGRYIRLLNGSMFNSCVMSNTSMEKRTNYDFIIKAHGDIFIAGLGIGLIILPIQEKAEVKSITILEKYPEVIELVGKQLPLNDKVKIIQGDVFDYEFSKGTKFDCIYFDIWNYTNSDVYEEMKRLKKKYQKYKRSKKDNPNVYIACWAEYYAKNNRPLL
jgi:predicted membrane-bound spermidine synthase